MAFGLLAGGQFFSFVRELCGYLHMACDAGEECRARPGVYLAIIASGARIVAIHAVMAACIGAFDVLFLAVHQVVALAAF